MSEKAEQIDSRFHPPENWRWHYFTRNQHKIRFGCVTPTEQSPDAIVIGLQGVRECTEKYYEIAHWCLKNNFAFWMMDWRGQGASDRYLENPQKRHAQNFKEDVNDLNYFINEYIEHTRMAKDKRKTPLVMLAHSMGGNIGMRYLRKYPNHFTCAAFSAPMIGIHAVRNMPIIFSRVIARFLNTLFGKSYVFGGGDWGSRQDHVTLSSDPIRCEVQNTLYKENPELRSGDVTYGWVYRAICTCQKVQNPAFYSKISTPCFFGIPEHEKLIDPEIALTVANSMTNAKSKIYPDAYHELLMERDEIRDDFLANFYNLIKESTITTPQTLKDQK